MFKLHGSRQAGDHRHLLREQVQHGAPAVQRHRAMGQHVDPVGVGALLNRNQGARDPIVVGVVDGDQRLGRSGEEVGVHAVVRRGHKRSGLQALEGVAALAQHLHQALGFRRVRCPVQVVLRPIAVEYHLAQLDNLLLRRACRQIDELEVREDEAQQVHGGAVQGGVLEPLAAAVIQDAVELIEQEVHGRPLGGQAHLRGGLVQFGAHRAYQLAHAVQADEAPRVPVQRIVAARLVQGAEPQLVQVDHVQSQLAGQAGRGLCQEAVPWLPGQAHRLIGEGLHPLLAVHLAPLHAVLPVHR